MEIESASIAKENVDRWTINPAYEIVSERGVPRLTKYIKKFSDDALVKVDGAPLILQSSGRALRVNEVMRERADLALNEDGHLLPQGEFHARYMEWLAAFSYPEGTELGLMPIPEVSRYVSECQDTYSESSGYIEIGFDPKLNEEWKSPEAKYDTEGRDKSASADLNEKLMEALVSKLSPDQAADLIGDAVGKDIPIVGDSAKEEVSVEAAPPPSTVVVAPCGRSCKNNAGLAAHMRHCDHELCGGDSDNSHRGDEAA